MRKMARAASLALLVGCIVPVPGAAMATGGGAMPYDFNGDGYADLAVGVPFEDVGSKRDAGIVQVLYGSAAGPTAHDQIWHQGRAGVKGAVERSDWFGRALASGDFDSDGFADLAAGIPNEEIGTKPGAGAVQILYGSPVGLTARDQVWHQGSTGVPGSNEPGDWFGHSLAAGDFDGDGYADLAIGAPQEDVGIIRDAGRAVVLRGSPGGLTAAGAHLLGQGSNGMPSQPTVNEWFAAGMVAGDVNGDGFDDVLITVGGEWDTRPAGSDDDDLGTALHLVLGGPAGLTAAGTQVVTPGALGEEPTSQFMDVHLTDLNGDGRADLTMRTRRGVAVLHGRATGLAITTLQSITVPGADGILLLPDVPALGGPVAGDVTGDGHPDLAFGSSESTVDVLLGTAQGLGLTTVRWTVAPGAATVSPLSGAGAAWLVLARPMDTVSGRGAAGLVTVVRGQPDGAIATSGVWHQDSPGIKGAAETGDMWGLAIG